MSASPIAVWLKDPQAVVPFGFDWTDWLSEISSSETIATATWTVPAGLTKDSDGLDAAAVVASAVLSGGTDGQDYLVGCRITTSSGYVDERTGRVQVRQR